MFPHWAHKNYPYGQFGVDHLGKMASGIKCFNDQHYWECHEELEDVWLEDRNDPARYIYWAVIQVAATMVHYRDKKIIGVQGMIKKAKEKFDYCQKNKVATDLCYEFLSWQELEELVFQIPSSGSSLDHFSKLFEFRFKNYPMDYFTLENNNK